MKLGVLSRTPLSSATCALTALVIILVGLLTAPSAEGFGTDRVGADAEHERITRVALACAPGTRSTGECFEPGSLDELAGRSFTFGAVSAPDKPFFGGEIFIPAAHCDNADYLDIPGYPQTREVAAGQLLACIQHMRMRFHQGIDRAGAVLRPDGTVRKSQIDLRDDCPFRMSVSRAKCDALEGFGRALHAAQDFYSHSNWADEANPRRPISIGNPPGLNLTVPSSILNLRDTNNPTVPAGLTTGYFRFPEDSDCPADSGRITHYCINKDRVLIDPVTGVASKPGTRRGRVLNNAQKAVTGAIVETRHQWAEFRAELISRYGAERGERIILALTQDYPRYFAPPAGRD